jgi:hypothetical protein
LNTWRSEEIEKTSGTQILGTEKMFADAEIERNHQKSGVWNVNIEEISRGIGDRGGADFFLRRKGAETDMAKPDENRRFHATRSSNAGETNENTITKAKLLNATQKNLKTNQSKSILSFQMNSYLRHIHQMIELALK